MSTPNESTNAAEPSLGKDVLNLGRYYLWRTSNWARPYLGGRRGLIILAIAVLGAGAALNWGWLVAIGVAPILVALAPCAAMCALGLCMKGGDKSCSNQSSSAGGDVNAPPPPPAFASKGAAAPNGVAALHAEGAEEPLAANPDATSPALTGEQVDERQEDEDAFSPSEPMNKRS